MTIKRLDHVSVVVEDFAAAIAFFTALGMTKEGEAAFPYGVAYLQSMSRNQ
jgi:catechol 2,3-dioxygenase-like lactoylglutathione lyase family enzyme